MNIFLLCALLSAALSGVSTLGRWMAIRDLPPFFISGVSWALGAVTLGIWCGRGFFTAVKNLSNVHRIQLYVFLFWGAIFNSLLFAWLPMATTASHTALFLRMEPYLIMLVAWMRHRHKPSTSEFRLLTVHLAGALLVSLGSKNSLSDHGTLFGDALAFLGLFISAMCYERSRQLSQLMGAANLSFIFAAVCSTAPLLLYFLYEQESTHLMDVSVFAWTGILLSCIYCVGSNPLLYYALKGLPSWKVSAFRVVSPLVTIPLAWLILKEQLNSVQMIGAFCVLVTTTALARQKVKTEGDH